MPLRICRVIAAVSVVLLVSAIVPLWADSEQELVATVNGQSISSQQLTDELLLRWGDLGLESLIQEIAIEQAAVQAGVEISDKEVNKRAIEFQRSIDMRAPVSGQSFTLWLADQKLSHFGFRKRIRIQMLLEKMVEDQVQVTDQEVADVWERNKDKLRQPERMHVSHICVKTEEEADRIRAEIVAGKAFAEAAEQYSIDPWTKDQSGDFGWIVRGKDPFQQAAFTLGQDGELSPVTETRMGWHIIRREEYQPASVANFEDIQDQFRDQILQQRRLQKMNQKRAEILAAAKIERNLDPADLVTTAASDQGGTD